MTYRTVILGAAAAAVALAAASIAARAATPEWDALVKAAQAEGQVEVILSGQVPALLRPAMPAFEEKYGIKVNFQTGGGREHNERVLAERRADRYTVDVWMGGVNPPLTSLYPNGILVRIDELMVDPDVKDPSKWFKGRHHYADPEGHYILAWGASPSYNISFNTNLVDPNEIKSYYDLLDPKWKGKIVTWSPAAPGTTGSSIPMFLNPKIGEPWFRRWASEMELTIVSDARQGAEWVALGRFPIGMFGLGTQARQLASEGFPIQEYLPHPIAEGEVLSSSAANIMVLDRAPHPNATKLFVNWALSKDAHVTFIKLAERMDSLRNDVPNDVLEPQYRIDKSVEYISTFSNPEYADTGRQKQILGTMKQIMKEAGYE